MPPCLTLSITREKWKIQGLVAIEKGAFSSPSTKVTNFIFYFLLSYLFTPQSNSYIYLSICRFVIAYSIKKFQKASIFLLSLYF